MPLLLLAGGCTRAPADFTWQAPAMGTTYRIKVIDAPADITRKSLRAEVDGILASIDRQFSTYRADSEISRFNRSDSTDWQPVSADMVTVISAARRMSELSQGAFDLTAGPLVALWGFGAEAGEPRVPDTGEIRRVQRHVGYRKLDHRRAPPALRKRDGRIRLDANALVAGHAADLVAARFEQLGIRNYLVDMGGEFRLGGSSRRGAGWRIALELPLPDAHRTGRVLELTDCAVSTSGNYRNYFEAEGRRFSHVLDARSGRQVSHDLAVVTVIAATALQADAWATVLLILGEKQGLALAEQESVAAMFITRRGDEFEENPSPAFHSLMVSANAGVRKVSPPPESRLRSGTAQALH